MPIGTIKIITMQVSGLTIVPEPSSLLLFSTGALLMVRKRRGRTKD